MALLRTCRGVNDDGMVTMRAPFKQREKRNVVTGKIDYAFSGFNGRLRIFDRIAINAMSLEEVLFHHSREYMNRSLTAAFSNTINLSSTPLTEVFRHMV